MDAPFSQATDDETLVHYAKLGNPNAFAWLIDRHAPRLKRLLRAILGNDQDVEDTFQEVLVRAFLNLERLRDAARFGAWIYRIAVNQARTTHSAYTHFRDTQVSESGSSLDGVPVLVQFPEPNPFEERLIRQEVGVRIREAVSDLPTAEREAIVLVYLNGLSHKETARQLGASLSAVKVRVHRGRNHLRQALRDEFGPAKDHKLLEVEMIKVMIHDIVKYDTPQKEEDLTEKMKKMSRLFRDTGERCVVLLEEVNGTRSLPIWIGSFEARSIAIHLKQNEELLRPLTFDLVKTLLSLGNVEVQRVDIHRLHEEVYYANLVVKIGEGEVEIDCRPSDALNLVVRLGIPVYVAPEIIESQGRSPDEAGGYVIDLKHPDIEWRSLLVESG